jgi:hypothetical protein
MDGAKANFSAILNFCKAHATVPLEVITLLKLTFKKYQKKVGSLSPRAYVWDLMVFNQYSQCSIIRVTSLKTHFFQMVISQQPSIT